MIKDSAKLYEAFNAKDTRFDGCFFVAISTTKIYCRPICKAKHPMLKNCTFYETAAEAEKNGYRPCLLCRPELAPGNSIMDSSINLAGSFAKLLEENCGSDWSLNEFSRILGCSDRHLRRVFLSEFNITPIQFLITNRLLLAKNLLTDTNLSILDVALSSGFKSLRSFNHVFKKHYHLVPTALRKKQTHKNNGKTITLSLGYRPPYRFKEILTFLKGRAISGIELVHDDVYMRTVNIIKDNNTSIHGWLKVRNNPKINALKLTISESLLPVLPNVIARIKHLFDLNSNPHIILDALMVMNNIKPNLCVLGTRLPGCFDSFEMSVRAVLGQQISVKAASTLANRITHHFGKKIETNIIGLTHIFPSPYDILRLEGNIENHLGPLGITRTRANTIYELAKAFANQSINLNTYLNPKMVMEKLMEIKGIGSWTAKYIAMRGMGYTDAFLESDVGIQKALNTKDQKQLLLMSKDWMPWRSYATINLWNSLENINQKEI